MICLIVVPQVLITLSTCFNVFVNTVGALAIMSRLLLKILPGPKINGPYKNFLNIIGHCGLCLKKVYDDI